MKTLYLAWRQPGHRWWPVGRLTRDGQEYVFVYTKGAVSAERAGFSPLANFPDRDEVYISARLFPLFANRLPPSSRPDYDDFVQWLDLGLGEKDPMVLLARSGGRRETDTFEVFPMPEPTAKGRYESSFFVHGLRHRGTEAEDEARRLNAGDPLLLLPEPGNAEDSNAVQVLTSVRGTHLGYVPRYLCSDVHQLQNAAGEQPTVRVRRINRPPSPAQFRVLCDLDSPWPIGFQPFSSPDFEPLHSFTTAPRR